MLRKIYWGKFIIYLICLFIINTGKSFASENFYQLAEKYFQAHGMETGNKCGFQAVLAANNPRNQELHNALMQLRKQRVFFDSLFISPSGHFRIHYNEEQIPDYDRNLNGIKDYLEFVASSFDRAWELEIETLGFRYPMEPDGSPREVYDVYCKYLGTTYGSTEFYLEDEITNVPGFNFPSEIKINTDFSFVDYPTATDSIARDSMAIAVTAAHEFNHSLQLSYNIWFEDNDLSNWPPHDIWFIESSATYMEEVVADEVNDYASMDNSYIRDYYKKIHRSFDKETSGLEEYGKSIFFIMLDQWYGRKDITRMIWEGILAHRALPALESVLTTLGSDMLTELTRLSHWIYFTGSFSIPGEFFPDAELFPDFQPWIQPADSIMDQEGVIVEDSLPRLSFKWYKSKSYINISPNLLLKAIKGGKAKFLNAVHLNPQNKQSFVLPSAVSFAFPGEILPPEIHFSVVNGRSNHQGYDNYQMLYRQIKMPNLSDIVVYPQPLILSDTEPFLSFKNVEVGTEIFIYSSNGRHLQTLKNFSTPGQISWDLSTKFGKKIGSGVYLYRLISNGKKKTGKFTVVRY